MDSAIIDSLCTGLSDSGYICIDSLMGVDLWQEQSIAAEKSFHNNQMVQASIGTKKATITNKSVRSDMTQWIDFPAASPIYEFLEVLRLELNKQLFLGLESWECHYAAYTPGAFYKKHFDQVFSKTHDLPNKSQRILTFILYLNRNWESQNGGELILYTNPLQKIEPVGGRFVLFRSELIEHEVLLTHKTRFSLTGWFRKGSL